MLLKEEKFTHVKCGAASRGLPNDPDELAHRPFQALSANWRLHPIRTYAITGCIPAGFYWSSTNTYVLDLSLRKPKI